MKNKFLVGIVCVAVMMMICFGGFSIGTLAIASDCREQVSVSDDVFIDNVNKGTSSFQSFMDSMISSDKIKTRNAIHSEKENCENVYSDNYAGTFIDDNGIFNLCVTNEALLSSPAMAKDLTVNYIVKKYSYNYLHEIAKTFLSLSNEFAISGTAVKQSENKAHIFYYDTEKLDCIKNFAIEMNYEEDAIEYIYREMSTPCSRVYAGDEIYFKSGFLWLGKTKGTAGPHVKDNDTGKVGILTNAHVAEAGKTMKHNDGTIGVATKRKMQESVDAAFIPYEKPGDWTIINSARGVDNLNHTYSNTKYSDVATWTQEGMRVRKFGITTGTTEGKIEYNDSSVMTQFENGNVLSLNDCLVFSNTTKPGDSGGPIYAIGGTKGSLWFIGLTFGCQSDYSMGFGCKATNIFRELNLSYYA